MVRGAVQEYFGMVSDGLIYAAVFPDRIWARKTRMPENLLDIAEIRKTANLPRDIQALCDKANYKWDYGTDRSWTL